VHENPATGILVAEAAESSDRISILQLFIFTILSLLSSLPFTVLQVHSTQSRLSRVFFSGNLRDFQSYQWGERILPYWRMSALDAGLHPKLCVLVDHKLLFILRRLFPLSLLCDLIPATSRRQG